MKIIMEELRIRITLQKMKRESIEQSMPLCPMCYVQSVFLLRKIICWLEGIMVLQFPFMYLHMHTPSHNFSFYNTSLP